MEPTDAAISGPFSAGTGTDSRFARACAWQLGHARILQEQQRRNLLWRLWLQEL